MENQKAIEVSLELDKIKLWKLPEYMFGRTLCSTNILYYNGEVTWRKCVYMLIRSCCGVLYSSNHYGNGRKVYFLFSSHNSRRKEHAETFKKIAATCRNRVELFFERVSLKQISLRSVFRVFLIPVWYYQIRKLLISRRHKIFLLTSLLCALTERDAIEQELEHEECSMLVCYFDGAMAESLVAQDFNQFGIKTATIQHGHFHPNGFAFYASVCQFFLANSNYESNLAKEAGVLAKYIITLGLGKYIGNEKKSFISNINKKEKIGIIFDGDDYFENNVKMLEIVKKVAVNNGSCIYVKYHPTSKISRYKSYVDENYIYEVDNCEIEKFMEEIDFIVIANSTILLEAIYLLKPWYRYCNLKEDVFAGIDQNIFSSFGELEKLLQKEVSLSEMIGIRDYVIGEKNPEKMYKKFFEFNILGLEETENSF